MEITNIRLGHATNSSSAHSIIWNSRNEHYVSDEIGRFQYGTESFVLTTYEEKLRYVCAGVYESLERLNITKEEIKNLLLQLFSHTPIACEISQWFEKKEKYYTTMYIDHQSQGLVSAGDPRNWDEFVENLNGIIEISKIDKIVIFGGGDYDGGYDGFNPTISLNSLKVRKDHNSLVVMNRQTGAKFRISSDGPYNKASNPELVDLKITDYCDFGCSFCYQNSTKSGVEADFNQICRIIDALSEIGVFEIAIGGGEPTTHSRFSDIIRYGHKVGLNINFSTFSDRWCNDSETVKYVNRCVSGIGVSTGTNLRKYRNVKNSLYSCKVIAQHVFGSASIDDTEDLIRLCAHEDIHLLLLGYKKVGRGKVFKQHDLTGIWDRIDTFPTLSIDTAMAKDHPEILTKLNTSNVFVCNTEGSFSMYIDAVKGTMSPSSYHEDVSIQIEDGNIAEQVTRAFQSFDPI